jgi:hypothetical protein
MGIGDARSDRVLLVVPCHSGPGQGAEPPMEPGMGMIPDPRRIGAGMRGHWPCGDDPRFNVGVCRAAAALNG